MQIKSISLVENDGLSTFWELDNFLISKVNLIVAKNATGKSRTLNVISHLANLISGEVKPAPNHNFRYDVNFDDEGCKITYKVCVKSGVITSELLNVGGENKIERDESGNSKNYFEEIKTTVSSKFSTDSLAISQRDSVQKPYLEKLFSWAVNTIHLRFGTQLGQNTLAAYNDNFEQEFNFAKTDAVTAYFKKAECDGNIVELKNNVIADLCKIGYKVSDIGYIDSGIKNALYPLYMLYVQESELQTRTHQELMSAGMYRAVSILVQINFLVLNRISCCLLIDDIGEGLDFERSTTLISNLIDKTRQSSIQLLMTSNDRFIMNGIPLEYWSILVRTNQSCKIINKHNSPNIFEDFEFTGLNNFDFFSTEFYKGNY